MPLVPYTEPVCNCPKDVAGKVTHKLDCATAFLSPVSTQVRLDRAEAKIAGLQRDLSALREQFRNRWQPRKERPRNTTKVPCALVNIYFPNPSVLLRLHTLADDTRVNAAALVRKAVRLYLHTRHSVEVASCDLEIQGRETARKRSGEPSYDRLSVYLPVEWFAFIDALAEGSRSGFVRMAVIWYLREYKAEESTNETN